MKSLVDGDLFISPLIDEDPMANVIYIDFSIPAQVFTWSYIKQEVYPAGCDSYSTTVSSVDVFYYKAILFYNFLFRRIAEFFKFFAVQRFDKYQLYTDTPFTI